MSQLLQAEVAGTATHRAPPQQDDWVSDDCMLVAQSRIVSRPAGGVQIVKTTGFGSGSTASASRAASVTAIPGDPLIFVCILHSTTATGCSDTRGSAWFLMGRQALANGGEISVWGCNSNLALNPATSFTVTVAQAASSTGQGQIWEFSGTNATPFDLNAWPVTGGTGTALTGATISPIAVGELLICAFGDAAGTSPPSFAGFGTSSGLRATSSNSGFVPGTLNFTFIYGQPQGYFSSSATGSQVDIGSMVYVCNDLSVQTPTGTFNVSETWGAVTFGVLPSTFTIPGPVYTPLMAGQVLGGPVMAAQAEPSLYLSSMTDDWMDEATSQLILDLEPDVSDDTTPPTVDFLMDGF